MEKGKRRSERASTKRNTEEAEREHDSDEYPSSDSEDREIERQNEVERYRKMDPKDRISYLLSKVNLLEKQIQELKLQRDGHESSMIGAGNALGVMIGGKAAGQLMYDAGRSKMSLVGANLIEANLIDTVKEGVNRVWSEVQGSGCADELESNYQPWCKLRCQIFGDAHHVASRTRREIALQAVFDALECNAVVLSKSQNKKIEDATQVYAKEVAAVMSNTYVDARGRIVLSLLDSENALAFPVHGVDPKIVLPRMIGHLIGSLCTTEKFNGYE